MQLLFPARCAFCLRAIHYPDRYEGLCPACVTTLAWRRPDEMCLPLVAQSALHLMPLEDWRCARALPVVVPFHYDAVLARALRRLKFHGVEEMAPPIGGAMADVLALSLPTLGAHRDTWAQLRLLPVPLSRARLRERGSNQARHLAEAVAAHGGPSLLDGGLARYRATARQTQVEAAARWRNVDGAFVGDARVLAGRSVVLVDDIMTSGLTLYAAARAAAKAGAHVLCGLVAASPRRTEEGADARPRYPAMRSPML